MKKTSGHLFKRNGTYYLQYDVNKKRKTVCLKVSTLTKAEDERDKILTDPLKIKTKVEVIEHIAKARNLDGKRKKVAIKDAWGEFEQSTKRPDSGQGTLNNYKRNWGKFEKWISSNVPAAVNLDDITEDNADDYTKFLWKKNISGNTFNYHLQSIRLVLKVLLPGGANPFAGIERKDENKIRREAFTREQVMSILAVFDKARFKVADKAELKLLVYLGAFTGLRLIDCIFIKWTNIDLDSGFITLTPRKTKKIHREVHIPMFQDLKNVIMDAVKKKQPEYLLPKLVDRYNSNSDGIIDDLRKVFKAAGIKNCKKPITDEEVLKHRKKKNATVFGFHSFRHGLASIASMSGMPIATLAEILGDNISTLQKYYIHVNDDSKRLAIKSLPLGKDSEVKETSDIIDVKVMDDRSLKRRIKKALSIIEKEVESEKTKRKLVKLLSSDLH